MTKLDLDTSQEIDDIPLTSICPKAVGAELRRTQVSLSILDLELRELEPLPTAPLQGFLQLNAPPLPTSATGAGRRAAEDVRLLTKLAYKSIAAFHERVEELRTLLALAMADHQEMVRKWTALLSAVLEGWTPQTKAGMIGRIIVTKETFKRAHSDAVAFAKEEEEEPKHESSWAKSQYTRIDNYMPATVPRTANVFASSHFVRQAMMARLAFHRITALIELELVQNGAQHAASISETMRAAHGPYRTMPLGGATTLPAHIWTQCLASRTIADALAASGNPLVVFQCVQDWIENGAEAALPRMLLCVPRQEAERLRGVGRDARGKVLWQPRPVVEPPPRSDASERRAMGTLAFVAAAEAAYEAARMRSFAAVSGSVAHKEGGGVMLQDGSAEAVATDTDSVDSGVPEEPVRRGSTRIRTSVVVGRSPLAMYVHNATEESGAAVVDASSRTLAAPALKTGAPSRDGAEAEDPKQTRAPTPHPETLDIYKRTSRIPRRSTATSGGSSSASTTASPSAATKPSTSVRGFPDQIPSDKGAGAGGGQERGSTRRKHLGDLTNRV